MMTSSSHDIFCIDEVPAVQRKKESHKFSEISNECTTQKIMMRVIILKKILLHNMYLHLKTINKENAGINNYLKFVTQTERIPASAAARQATGTTSETCSCTIVTNCQETS